MVKKSSALTADEKRAWIDRGADAPSVARQCELLGLARSSYYYAARPQSEWNVRLLSMIDEQTTPTPFYGVARVTYWLRRQDQIIGPKRVRRLMRTMGLEAIYPKPRLSLGGPQAVKYPYLLKGLKVARPNQVWLADIT